MHLTPHKSSRLLSMSYARPVSTVVVACACVEVSTVLLGFSRALIDQNDLLCCPLLPPPSSLSFHSLPVRESLTARHFCACPSSLRTQSRKVVDKAVVRLTHIRVCLSVCRRVLAGGRLDRPDVEGA